MTSYEGSPSSEREQAVLRILRYFALEKCPQIWRELVSDKQTREKLAFVGDAALRFYVSKEFVVRGVKTAAELHAKTQAIITNERLAKLAAELDLDAAIGGEMQMGTRFAGTLMEALLGAGEVYASGKHTREVVSKVMSCLDAI